MADFRVWRVDDVVWGETACEAPGCHRPAELLAEFEDYPSRGVPLCVDDADLLLERTVAIAEHPELAYRLGDPWELRRPIVRTFRRGGGAGR